MRDDHAPRLLFLSWPGAYRRQKGSSGPPRICRPMRTRLAVLLAGAALAAALPQTVSSAAPPSENDQPPGFLVGAAARDITPAGEVNLGGFGLGDGSVFPDPPVGRGNTGKSEGERIYARALVIDNGTDVLALVITPNIGMFAKYQNGPGLIDIAESVAASSVTEGRIPSDHVIAAGNHSHSGPDTLGAWGGVDTQYLQLVHDQAVAAVEEAYASRRPGELLVGVAEGRQTFAGSQGTYDLLDNQVCLEVADNSFEGTQTCAPRQESVDSDVRVLQAITTTTSTGGGNSNQGCDGPGNHNGRTCTREVIASFVTYAAHPTLGGAGGLHGDWPEYLAAGLESTYGGVGIAWPGAIGRVQPERNWTDRKRDFTTNLLTMVDQALKGGSPVEDTEIAVAKALVRTEVTNPVLAGLLHGGELVGAPLMRSREAPWMVGPTVQTVVSGARVGDVAFMGVPGEAYPQIALEAAATAQGERTLFTLGVADDMLGYLIAHEEDYPVIAGLTPVNDNALFNVSPRIGDHVMCAGVRLLDEVGFAAAYTPATLRCPAYDVEDLVTGD